MSPLSWLATSLVCTAFAQIAFKQYFCARAKRWLASAVLLFVLIPYSTMKALQGLPLSTVYIATAGSQLLVVILSLVLMGEKYSKPQYAGFAFIVAGVLLFNL